MSSWWSAPLAVALLASGTMGLVTRRLRAETRALVQAAVSVQTLRSRQVRQRGEIDT